MFSDHSVGIQSDTNKNTCFVLEKFREPLELLDRVLQNILFDNMIYSIPAGCQIMPAIRKDNRFFFKQLPDLVSTKFSVLNP